MFHYIVLPTERDYGVGGRSGESRGKSNLRDYKKGKKKSKLIIRVIKANNSIEFIVIGWTAGEAIGWEGHKSRNSLKCSDQSNGDQ